MGVCLHLRALQASLNRKGFLKEIKGRSHFSDSAIVASHVVEGHRLPQLVIFDKLFGLFQKVKGRINVFFL